MAENGAKREILSPLAQRLVELQHAQAELTKLIQTTKTECTRREKEVKSLLALVERQSQSIINLRSKRTKVVLLQEYRAVLLSINLNNQNLILAQSMAKEAKRHLAEHEQRLAGCLAAIEAIQKELDSRGKLIPFRKAS